MKMMGKIKILINHRKNISGIRLIREINNN